MSTKTACVNKGISTFTNSFLRNRHKSSIRTFNSIVDINNSFHRIFVLCNLDLWFKSYSKFCEVPLNLFGLVTKEPVWPVDQLLTISYSFLLERYPFCKAFLCCMISVSKLRFSIVIPLNNDGLISLLGWHVIAYGSHHLVCLQGLANEVNVFLVFHDVPDFC